jgi:hypothetical protein
MSTSILSLERVYCCDCKCAYAGTVQKDFERQPTRCTRCGHEKCSSCIKYRLFTNEVLGVEKGEEVVLDNWAKAPRFEN